MIPRPPALANHCHGVPDCASRDAADRECALAAPRGHRRHDSHDHQQLPMEPRDSRPAGVVLAAGLDMFYRPRSALP